MLEKELHKRKKTNFAPVSTLPGSGYGVSKLHDIRKHPVTRRRQSIGAPRDAGVTGARDSAVTGARDSGVTGARVSGVTSAHDTLLPTYL